MQEPARPRVTVLVRSYKRPSSVAELLENLVQQRYDSFEIVVVEQTPHFEPAELARLEPLWADPRVQLVRRPPLGGAGARNEGFRHARGDIVILIDDDDLPTSLDWVAQHESYYRDPRLMGVGARHVREVGESCPYPDALRPLIRQVCGKFSPLKVPHVHLPRFDEDITPIDWITGTNSSVRREVAFRVGLWDESVSALEDVSFSVKFQKAKRPGEYLAWRREPTVLRRLDMAGGMGRRRHSIAKELHTQLNFTHQIIGTHHPERFRRAYPLYLGSALVRTLAFVWDYEWFEDSATARAARTKELLQVFPRVLREVRASGPFGAARRPQAP